MHENRVILCGSVLKTPIIRVNQSGRKHADLIVETVETFFDRAKQSPVERRSWHKIRVDGHAVAHRVDTTLAKGCHVRLGGRLKSMAVERKDGLYNHFSEIVIDESFGFIDPVNPKTWALVATPLVKQALKAVADASPSILPIKPNMTSSEGRS